MNPSMLRLLKWVYHHGTGPAKGLRPLTHFGSKAAAEHVAKASKSGRTMQGAFRFANPVMMKDSKRAHTPTRILEDLVEAGYPRQEMIGILRKIEKENGREVAERVLVDRLRKDGYDAIQYQNTNEDPGSWSFMSLLEDQFTPGGGT